MATTDPPQTQVKLQLTSRDPAIALPDNSGPILVNTGLRRYALSTLVNHLLETAKPVPFEFLINGTFLRTSIDEFLTTHGLSAETTLTAEYIRALVPPVHVASFQHDDWVSSVDVLSASSKAGGWSAADRAPSVGQERILSGSFDGLLRIWNTSSQVIATSPSTKDGGHASSIKTCRFVTADQVASSGYDRSIRLWKYSEDAQTMTGSLAPQLELYGHKAGVNHLDVHGPSQRVLTASDDHSVGFWSTKKGGAPSAPTELTPQAAGSGSKRKKVSTSVSTPQRGPLALLSAHTGPVTGTIFDPRDHTVGYSTSYDHTLRTWDLPTGSAVDTRTTAHALFSLCALPEHSLIAVGTSARHITLIDPRASATRTTAMTLRGHNNTVVALQPDPSSSFGLLSGSHDGTCRIWDIRSSRSDNDGVVGASTYTIPRESVAGETGRRVAGEGVKVFDVCWDKDIGIVSAGEDKRVQINQGSGVTATSGADVEMGAATGMGTAKAAA